MAEVCRRSIGGREGFRSELTGMPYTDLLFSTHAARRMYERGIYREDVQRALVTGEVIERYPDDTPLPSYLLLAWLDREPGQHLPVHIVCADEAERERTHIITVYWPDLDRWQPDYKTRRER